VQREEGKGNGREEGEERRKVEDPPMFKVRGHRPDGLVIWLSGNALVTINEVTLRQARLILGWVTVCRQVHHLSL